MIYWDSSLIVKLYIREEQSPAVVQTVKSIDLAIPFTHLHDLEINNALNLKLFCGEVEKSEVDYLRKKIQTHEEVGVYYRPSLDWTDIFRAANDFSNRHTSRIDVRSLDILHVAIAISIGAESFMTNDIRQRLLATAVGLKIETLR